MITRILIIGACKISYHKIDPISMVHVYFEKYSNILFIFALTWIANTETHSQKNVFGTNKNIGMITEFI